jgi:putative flippase GtrA
VKYGKFLVVGLTGFVVNLIIFTLVLDAISPGPSPGFFESIAHFLSETSPNPIDSLIASAVAFVVATFWNFTLNNAWTFRTRLRRRHSLGYRLALYFAVSMGSLAINEIVLALSSTTLPPLYGQGVGIVAGSLVGFLGNARITFAEAEAVEPN